MVGSCVLRVMWQSTFTDIQKERDNATPNFTCEQVGNSSPNVRDNYNLNRKEMYIYGR